jgi:hypothetical protein
VGSHLDEAREKVVNGDSRLALQATGKEVPGTCDVHAHLNKLQTMHEDLALMGGSTTNEDLTSIILGSIPPSYDIYITAISATSSLLSHSLSPTNLIDAICDKADQKAIKNPKSKRDEHNTAFVAGQSKRGSGGSKKSKKDIECWNCHKK